MALIHYAAFIILVLCTVPSSSNPIVKAKDPFSFEDIFNSSFRPRRFSTNWISGDEFLYRSDSGAVMRYNATSDIQTVFIDNSTFTSLNTGSYYVSKDLQYVLFAYQTKSLWRHSFGAKYKILEVSSGNTYNLSGAQELQYAGWSASGHALSFVHENNLYYQQDPTSTAVQLTSTNDPVHVFNGIPDWLYEEDVLSTRVAHYWSPDSRYILYARINNTGVPLQSWPVYGDKSDVFGTVRQIPYPKAGDVRNGAAGPNSRVEMFIVDVNNISSGSKPVSPPAVLASQDHYYIQAAWQDNTHALIEWTNRVQNHSITEICNAATDPIVCIRNREYMVAGGWVEVPPTAPKFIDNGARYLTIASQDLGGDIGAWRHLALINTTVNSGIDFLMTGLEEADYIAGYDSVKQMVYYVSTRGDSTERHIVRVDLATRTHNCLTCTNPAACRYLSASMSHTTDHYLQGCLGPDVPTYHLKSTVTGMENKHLPMEANTALIALLETKAMPTRDFINVTVGDNYIGKAEVFYPPDHAPGEKRPLLVYVYAGPGSQRVMKTFPLGGSTNNWLMYMKSTHRIAMASLDGRGAAYNGDKMKFEMYRRLATVEVQDQITGGVYFASLPDFVDTERNMAVFGWSYGGGTTSHIIGDTSKTFMCGAAVAPVTTKMYYDTAYTERYLALATRSDNEGGYNGTDVMNKVQNFKGKQYLIAHGTADDNVHFMHATHLIRALSDADVKFRQYMYVDENHSIGAPGQSRHLYGTLTDFLVNDCWNGLAPAPTQPPVTTAVPQPSYSIRTASTPSLLGALLVCASLVVRWIAG